MRVRPTPWFCGLLWLVVALHACRGRPRVASSPAPLAVRATEHCWWSTNRTALPPDSVAARFEHAFAVVGLARAQRAALGDTTWVQSAPTVLPSAPVGRALAMHAVAYAVGDSARYRYFVSAIGPAAAADSAWGGVLPLCTAVARAAAIPGVQPAQPTGEETATVWRWRPE